MRTFSSDNNAGVHPDILKAIEQANNGHVIGYGDDEYTQKAKQKFKELFGNAIDVYFVWGGTGANVAGLKTITDSYHAIICAETAHIYEDETGAPEKFTGCKLIPVKSTDGKIHVDQIKKYMSWIGDFHRPQPKVISITQATEFGTVYEIDEIKSLADLAHQNDMLIHMDGARLANAAVYLHKTLKEITLDAGIDVLSFGGTKNGMMYGEAVVFFDKNLSKNFKYIHKQSLQLASKMRFISVQFEELLSNNLWYKNAENANKMATLLSEELVKLPGVKITQKTQANEIFAIIPQEYAKKLQKKCFFYDWNINKSEYRFVCSFDTTEDDVTNFISYAKEIIK